MDPIQQYIFQLPEAFLNLANEITTLINEQLPMAQSKIWHKHPVWFINDNPIVGISLEKKGLRLMFWSGVSFQETYLTHHGKKFKDASIYFNSNDNLNVSEVAKCLQKSISIQWDYKNIVKNKGKLNLL